MAGATTTCAWGRASRTPRRASRPSPRARSPRSRRSAAGGWTSGIGRGDSARRVLGKAPTSMAMLEEAALVIRDLAEGRRVEYEGTWLQFDWTRAIALPLWIAGYGPKAMELAGTDRRRDHDPARRSRPRAVLRGAGARRGARRRPRPRVDPGDGGRARARRRPRPVPRSDALVPGAGLEPRRGSRQPLPARPAAAQPDRLHPRPRPGTTTSTTPRSARRTRPSWATR